MRKTVVCLAVVWLFFSCSGKQDSANSKKEPNQVEVSKSKESSPPIQGVSDTAQALVEKEDSQPELAMYAPDLPRFFPDKQVQIGNYKLLEMIYEPDKDSFYLVFADTSSKPVQLGDEVAYLVMYAVYPSHLSLEGGRISFYSHSGELGEVQMRGKLISDGKKSYRSATVDISFLSKKFEDVNFVRKSGGR